MTKERAEFLREKLCNLLPSDTLCAVVPAVDTDYDIQVFSKYRTSLFYLGLISRFASKHHLLSFVKYDYSAERVVMVLFKY